MRDQARRLWKIGGATLGVAVILSLAVIASSRWISAVGGTREEFIKTAGLWAGAITAVATALFAMLSAYFQSQWNADLEETKGRLNRALEFVKGRYAAERKAYDELLAVGYVYYYTLAELESHRFSPDRISKADAAMIAACRYLAAIDGEARRAWVSFWQAARALAEEAAGCGGRVSETRDSPVGIARHGLWSQQAGGLGGKWNGFVKVAAEKHRQIDDMIGGASSSRRSG